MVGCCLAARWSGREGHGPCIAPDVHALPSPSREQERVIKAVRQGLNVGVAAVAGSGKTTTILQVAHAFPNRKILGIVSTHLVLTIALLYNQRLMVEMRDRQNMLQLTDNLQVDSYHALCIWCQRCYHGSGVKEGCSRGHRTR